MKIYQVRIDIDPGGWKSGEDQKILVLADSPEEAIEVVKSDTWGENSMHSDDMKYSKILIGKKAKNQKGYSNWFHKPYINSKAQFSAIEISFVGYNIKFTTDREEKLERILKDKS
jgi:hypothetical protein